MRYAGDSSLTLWGRDPARLEAVAARCRGLGASVETRILDLTDAAGVAPALLADDARSAIDVAIFNAGLGGVTRRGDAAEDPARSLSVALVNFASVVAGANAVAARMAARGAGKIVIVSSVADSIPLPMAPTYAGSKAGLKMFATSLRVSLRRHGLCVTLVAPGFVDTPMSASLKAPRPFLVSAEAAATIIAEGVARGKAEIAFPWPFALARALIPRLPRFLQEALLAWAPKG